jgi:hypothetical protein
MVVVAGIPRRGSPMSGLLYEVNRMRTEDLLREGERQRLASEAKPATPATSQGSSRRVVAWPFHQVARVARLARAAASPVS